MPSSLPPNDPHAISISSTFAGGGLGASHLGPPVLLMSRHLLPAQQRSSNKTSRPIAAPNPARPKATYRAMSGPGHTDGVVSCVVYGVVVTFLGIPVISAYTTTVNGIETVVVYAVLGSISGGVIGCCGGASIQSACRHLVDRW